MPEAAQYNATWAYWLPRIWCTRCDPQAAPQFDELAHALLPHVAALLLTYLTLRARQLHFVQVDRREREAAMLRRALALLGGGALEPAGGSMHEPLVSRVAYD